MGECHRSHSKVDGRGEADSPGDRPSAGHVGRQSSALGVPGGTDQQRGEDVEVDNRWSSVVLGEGKAIT